MLTIYIALNARKIKTLCIQARGKHNHYHIIALPFRFKIHGQKNNKRMCNKYYDIVL